MGAPFFRTLRRGFFLFSKRGIILSAQGAEGGALRAGTEKGRDISFSKRDIPPLNPPRENLHCGFAARRAAQPAESGAYGFLYLNDLGCFLSSLSLCLRIGSLMQFPSTLDFCCLAFACQSGIAALAARMGAVGRHCCARRRVGLNLRS